MREASGGFGLTRNATVRPRRCKDCPAGTSRAAPHPGPRCATHHRQHRRQVDARAHDARIARVYAVPRGFYAKLVAFQGGRCAICWRATGKRRRLALDHRHSDGQPRGALCSPCNRTLGMWRDNPDIFRRAADYLEHPPAQQLLGAA